MLGMMLPHRLCHRSTLQFGTIIMSTGTWRVGQCMVSYEPEIAGIFQIDVAYTS
jgi:hypothetical protein